MQLDAFFPLAPTLSPGERESYLAVEGKVTIQGPPKVVEECPLSLGRGSG
jgi:hypothetical protein